ncbi:MAG: carboxypeptidase regulatory-like domain-containing protein, partial [Planctomycetes bacterium]|nr:carboxypeptidase regulatory-like domain-containing protein [Planctomycetota bacterium]
AAGERTNPTEPPPIERSSPPAAPLPPQGLRGLVLDETGLPLAGVQVHLLDSASNDPLALPLILQQRLPTGPLASTESAADGTFAIGLPRVQDRSYELHFLSPRHAAVRLSGLRLLEATWHDLGAVTMVPGATVRGRVTVEGLSTPVPNAVVTIEAGTAFDDVARRSLPDGHHGLVATTDALGRYELRHAPARGAVRLVAVAPGFARVVRQDVELLPDRATEVDFALPPGVTLRGRVVDADARPVAGARIEAWPSQAPLGASVATSEHGGAFELAGLRRGPHRIRVTARGFQTAEVAEVAADRQDLVVALVPRGQVLVRAATAEGTVLRTYQLGVRRYFEDRGGQIGFVADVPDQSVRLDGMSERALLEGLPPGTFVCEVTAAGHARSRSAPFTVLPQPGPPQPVDVTVGRGATLRGRVELDDGTPLAGAEVSSHADGADPDSPIGKLLAGNVPETVTAARTRTAADGSFALPYLTMGAYQLVVEHDEACRTTVAGLRIEQPTDLVLPAIRVTRGAEVSGQATIGGRLAGQIQVVLMEAGAGRQGPTTRIETITDAEGRFRLPRRVPPGTYELRAAVVGGADADRQFLHQLLQLQRSSTTVLVPPGADRVVQDIDIPDNR